MARRPSWLPTPVDEQTGRRPLVPRPWGRCRHRRACPWSVPVREVEQLQHAESVGQAVVQLEQVGRLPVRQPTDEQRLPRWALRIQGPRREDGRDGVQVVDRTALGEPEVLQVVAEVEVRVRRPGRRDDRQRRVQHAFTQSWNALGPPVVRGDESIPVGFGVEDLHDDASRSGAVVSFRPPHDRLPGTELTRAAPRGQRVVAPWHRSRLLLGRTRFDVHRRGHFEDQSRHRGRPVRHRDVTHVGDANQLGVGDSFEHRRPEVLERWRRPGAGATAGFPSPPGARACAPAARWLVAT